jgi:hypothetical protein
MRFKKSTALVAALLMGSPFSYADFKYSETSKITGGAMMNAVKVMGVFSKQARQSIAPTTRTFELKGNKLRTEESDGSIQIIDLDGRRFINIDPKTRTYAITTFDDMKKAMERRQAEMQQKKQAEEAQQDKTDQANVKITPKFESHETGASKAILGMPTREVRSRMEMTMESTDPKTQGQQVTTVINSDQWIAPDVPGYSELRNFYLRMAKEMRWFPGHMMGAMANSSIQLSLDELRKSNLAQVTGMPMLTYISMTMAGSGQEANGQTAAQQPPPQQQPEHDTTIPTSPADAVMEGLGGMFGHKKKKPDPEAANPNESAPNPVAAPGSLMDMQTEVSSYSNAPLDSSLFEPPAGYLEQQVTPQELVSGKH